MEYLELTIISQYREMLGLDVFEQTLELYTEQSDIYLNKLQKTIELEDYALWKDNCHVLKSASGNTGLKLVHKKVSDLEYSDKPFTELAKELDGLIELNQISIKELKKWLAES